MSSAADHGLYGPDLARIHADGYDAHASAAGREVLARFARATPPVRRVYDVGCGAGVTTRALVGAGLTVTAVDPSDALLSRARSAAPSATFVCASAYDVVIEPCDPVLAVGEVLGYHAPEVDGAALREDDGRFRRGTEVHHVQTLAESNPRAGLGEVGFDVEVAQAYDDAPLLLRRRRAFIATKAGR